jgi:hypothetical protein
MVSCAPEGALIKPTLSGKLAQKADVIIAKVSSGNVRASEMRRGLDQILQEFVITKVIDELFPELEAKVAALRIPSPFIVDRVIFMVKTRVETVSENTR